MPFQKGNKLAPGGPRLGAGRRPLKVRELCEKTFFKRIPLLAAIADNPDEKAQDRVAAMKLLSSVGIPERKEVTGAEGGPLAVKFIGEAEKWSK